MCVFHSTRLEINHALSTNHKFFGIWSGRKCGPHVAVSKKRWLPRLSSPPTLHSSTSTHIQDAHAPPHVEHPRRPPASDVRGGGFTPSPPVLGSVHAAGRGYGEACIVPLYSPPCSSWLPRSRAPVLILSLGLTLPAWDVYFGHSHTCHHGLATDGVQLPQGCCRTARLLT